MTYSAFPTVVTGDLWTAANHNAFIRDNFAASAPGIFTTKGDILAATGLNASARVGVGANYSVLEAMSSAAGGVQWSTGHGWKGHTSGAQAFLDGDSSGFTFAVEDINTDDFFHVTNTRADIPAGMGGIYFVGGFCTWAAHSTVSRWRSLYLASSAGTMTYTSCNDATHTISQSVSGVFLLPAGTNIALWAIQNSGATINANLAYFWGVRIR